MVLQFSPTLKLEKHGLVFSVLMFNNSTVGKGQVGSFSEWMMIKEFTVELLTVFGSSQQFYS